MNFFAFYIIFTVYIYGVMSYDPTDKEIETIIPKEGDFEAFYPRETHGISNSVARAPHAHGSFFQHRNPGESINDWKFFPFFHNTLFFLFSFDRH